MRQTYRFTACLTTTGWRKLCATRQLLVLFGVMVSFPLSGPSATATSKEVWFAENLPAIVSLYRELHQNPELSFAEKQTSGRLANELRNAAAEVEQEIGGYGVVGLLKNGPGKVLMLRADMDALPVIEQTGLNYASQVRVPDPRGATVGVMHACGHDIHMANLIGTARFLNAHRDLWAGTVIFFCQPAEERGAGAEAMLEDGLFVRFPRPDFAIALHVSHNTAAGEVQYRSGYSQANVDSVDITVMGRGGHGAYPETTIDPIIIAARLVLDLQTIVSREVKPIEPAIITVGSIHGGTKHNIIGNDCHLQLTVRSYAPKVRQQLHEAIRRKARAAAESAGAPEPKVAISEGTPSLYNDPQLTNQVVSILKRTLGNPQVKESAPSMGGEDFSRYGKAGVPICMFKLGSVLQDRLDGYASKGIPPPSLHSPLFYPDAELTLQTGICAMTSIAVDLLAPGKITQP